MDKKNNRKYFERTFLFWSGYTKQIHTVKSRTVACLS